MAKEVLLSDAPGDGGGGGGGFEAPPPPGGLGNFKGVMLCNRPSELPLTKAGDYGDGGAESRPFRSTVAPTHNDQLGLNPPPKKLLESAVNEVPVNEVMKRHGQWLRQLKQKIKDERAEKARAAEAEEGKRVEFAEFCKRQRDCVRDATAAQQEGSGEDLTEEQKRKELEVAIKAKQRGKKKSKPLWAMTKTEEAEFEEEQAAELIDFAENLDFDQFIHDMEFREALHAVQSRAGRVQKEQDEFKARLVEEFNALSTGGGSEDEAVETGRDFEDGIEGTSIQDTTTEGDGTGQRRRAKASKKEIGDGRPEWDISTTAEDRDRPDEKTRETAERALEDRRMKQIHSKESVQKIIENQKEKESQEQHQQQLARNMQNAANLIMLVEHLQTEASAPNPVISVSEDVLGRANKPKDPSMLPYLYRSPAV